MVHGVLLFSIVMTGLTLYSYFSRETKCTASFSNFSNTLVFERDEYGSILRGIDLKTKELAKPLIDDAEMIRP